MGKVRGYITDDSAAIAQWIGRKINNHQPMKSRDTGWGDSGRVQKHLEAVRADAKDPTTVYYLMNDGRKFAVSVRELGPDETPALKAFIY